MGIDLQALINKMTNNYAENIAIKEQQLAMAQVQIDSLKQENEELKAKVTGKKAK